MSNVHLCVWNVLLTPAIGAPKDSVLKSLFVSLSPYQEDGEQRGGIQISGVPFIHAR